MLWDIAGVPHIMEITKQSGSSFRVWGLGYSHCCCTRKDCTASRKAEEKGWMQRVDGREGVGVEAGRTSMSILFNIVQTTMQHRCDYDSDVISIKVPLKRP